MGPGKPGRRLVRPYRRGTRTLRRGVTFDTEQIDAAVTGLNANLV